jgi:uncharacterized protein YcbK (DUF882 family)
MAARKARERFLLSLLRKHTHSHVDDILRALPGLVVTSTYRTPRHNARVGGVPNSLHMQRRACDLSGTRAEQNSAVLRARLAGAVEALDEGDHCHLAW